MPAALPGGATGCAHAKCSRQYTAQRCCPRLQNAAQVPPPPATAFRGFSQLVDDLTLLACADGRGADSQAEAPPGRRSSGDERARAPAPRLAFSTSLGVHRFRTGE